ncbi:MAG: hypothetical protein US63_C0014G0011 [Candidatus Moranbacteria bacterium GW2011_GWC2_37_8]|nr:MAG: hypothetical protein US63_C0014G0011 [Candidatus Moranbacteria bacterium GW2011_GWC2_37_8]KKQ62282.1 MAG: hypothetical protein US82_C0015G0011 [Parcubacteria group bacterium GW2011_GWC1_38_22]KKQ80670.1 MAG: hypothetical protein UT03_C0020G0002 [Candidatus Moranbacteria bacterium GW2011_GWD2_38_7]
MKQENKKVMLKKIFLSAIAFAFMLFPVIVSARENPTDWYIKDFDSQIIVNKDSSLSITETIIADTGKGIDKHGIFRILPTRLNIDGKKINTPVELASITDKSGQAYEYQTIRNSQDGTITWKIGSANKTVQGVNVYVINYKVQNAIRFGNENFDELYWNLSGNFWDLEIDKFHATVKFPQEVTNKNATVEYYTGFVGSKAKDLATYKWSSASVLEFDSTKTLLEKQGITASIIFPKNIFTPYAPGFWTIYGDYFYFLIPFAVLAILFLVWKKYGDDPSFNKTIIAEYEIPADLSPIEAGMLMKSGGFDNSFITAEIITFATKGLVNIKEIENKVLFFTSKNYKLVSIDNPEVEKTLNDAQHEIMGDIFRGGQTVKLSTLKNSFYKNIPSIKKAATKSLVDKGLIVPTGFNIGMFMRIFGPFLLFFAFPFSAVSFFLMISLAISAVLIFAFSFIMPKRTLVGAEMNWKINGFKLFMETVDKDRAAFYEKENIFEKCLPYAILFGMTKQWIKKMQEIYGAEYFASHVPLWYAGGMSSFDADSFASSLESLSSDIAANTSAPSGSSGGGMSGGGGGGGGGGGW